MKGIITKYLQDESYGFIKNENEQKFFFHINDLQKSDQNKFLNNITDYCFSDGWEYRTCYVVEFTEGTNNQGLKAFNIKLTPEIFNDPSVNQFNAKITNIKQVQGGIPILAQGISNGQSPPPGATVGGNGTHRIGYPSTINEINIHFRKTNGIGWGKIDVRDLLLTQNNRTKVTSKLIESLKRKIIGKNIIIKHNGKSFSLADPKELVV
jgi:'Cold-shock' DNA-binding domain